MEIIPDRKTPVESMHSRLFWCIALTENTCPSFSGNLPICRRKRPLSLGTAPRRSNSNCQGPTFNARSQIRPSNNCTPNSNSNIGLETRQSRVATGGKQPQRVNSPAITTTVPWAQHLPRRLSHGNRVRGSGKHGRPIARRPSLRDFER